MSLLLDALHRASLDKAALAAAAQTQADKKVTPTELPESTSTGIPVGVPASVPVEPVPLSLTAVTPYDEPVPLSLTSVAQPAWPSLEPSALKVVPDSAAVTDPSATSAEPQRQAALELAEAQADLSLAPRMQESKQPFSPAIADLADPIPIPDLVALVTSTSAPNETSVSHAAIPAAFEPEPVASGAESMASAKSPAASKARPPSTLVNNNGIHAAQNLLRAKQPTPSQNRTRLIALASVAFALATAMGAIWLGALGDPIVLAENLGFMAEQPSLVPPLGSSSMPTQEAVSAVPVVATVEPVDNTSTARSAQSLGVTAPLPLVKAAVRKPVVPHSHGSFKSSVQAGSFVSPRPTSSHTRMAASVLALPLGCPPGTLPPDCMDADSAGNVGLVLQGSVQSRSSEPSILEQGYSALTQGRLQEAQTAYAGALQINPEERDALLGMAYIAQKQQRPDDAQAYYRQVLRQEPDNAVARAGLLTLNSLSNSQEFSSQSRLFAEQNPASAAAQSMLGHALVRQDRLADAQLAFAKALQLEPTVARHAYNLAIALDRLHDYTGAQRYYERALALLAQPGGERTSGFALADVQLRLAQLRATE